MKPNIYTLRAEVPVPPHEQTAMADYPHHPEINIYRSVVNMHLMNNFDDQLRDKFEELPLHRWDEFDEKTHNFHFFAEMYIVSKELLEDYERLKNSSNNH